MFSNWRGLNIMNIGNWIVYPLMEMCQTCSYTQQTADSEWWSTRARTWGVERRGKGKREKFILFAWLQRRRCHDESEKLGHVVLLPLRCLELFHRFYLMLAPRLSKSCWLCSQHSPPGYLVRSDCRQSTDALALFQWELSFAKMKSHFYRCVDRSISIHICG